MNHKDIAKTALVALGVVVVLEALAQAGYFNFRTALVQPIAGMLPTKGA